jgi:hypothetical protein
MQLAHERAPDGFADIDDVIPRVELEEIAARYTQLAGFAPEQVNGVKVPGTRKDVARRRPPGTARDAMS